MIGQAEFTVMIGQAEFNVMIGQAETKLGVEMDLRKIVRCISNKKS